MLRHINKHLYNEDTKSNMQFYNKTHYYPKDLRDLLNKNSIIIYPII